MDRSETGFERERPETGPPRVASAQMLVENRLTGPVAIEARPFLRLQLEQLATLRALGCAAAQGYLLSVPVTDTELAAYVIECSAPVAYGAIAAAVVAGVVAGAPGPPGS
jgi:hypothetical protein